MRWWILQTNAARLDIDRYLSERTTVVWGCGRFAAPIAPGDRAFLWRAAGGTKTVAGIVALATVIEAAGYRTHDAPECCRDDRLLLPKLRVVLRVDETRIADPLPRREIKGLPAMVRHPVVTANQGCAFAVSEDQASAMLEAWG